MEADVCSEAPKFMRVDPENAELVAFARRAFGHHSANSEWRDFPEQQVSLMTNVCIDRLQPIIANDPILLGSWFRLGYAPLRLKIYPIGVNRSDSSNPGGKLPPVRTGLVGSVWLPAQLMSLPCPPQAGLLSLNASPSTSRWAPPTWQQGPPANETMWLTGMTLASNENHITNFHHWNRDMAFFNRFLAKRYIPVSRLLITSIDIPAAWGYGHMRALLPPSLWNGTLWNTGTLRRTNRHKTKRQLSRQARVPATRYICLECVAQKLLSYPGDALDFAQMRSSAYAYCNVLADVRWEYVLLELRGPTNTSSRRILNTQPVTRLLTTFAENQLRLPLEVHHFEKLSYCAQVRAAVSRPVFSTSGSADVCLEGAP
jgi:hypothetical protein